MNRKNWTWSRKFTQITSIRWKDRENRSSRYWGSFARSKKKKIKITEGKIYSPFGKFAGLKTFANLQKFAKVCRNFCKLLQVLGAFILFNPLGSVADWATYFACVNFLFFIFFTISKAISVSTGPIFTIFSLNGRYLRELSWPGQVFQIPQGTLPWQQILCRKQNTNYVRFFAIFTSYESVLGVDDRLKLFSISQGTLSRQPIFCHNGLVHLEPKFSGSAGPIFTIFAPYGRYWIADDQSALLFPMS